MSDSDILRMLRDNDARLHQTETKETALIGAGAAFPASPAVGRLFYRTDLNWWCYYDGARWLTVQEFQVAFPMQIGTTILTDIALRSFYTLYFSTITIECQVATTNNAGNHYDVYIQTINLAQTLGDTLLTVSTAADGVATWTLHQAAATTPIPTATNLAYARMTVVRTGAPGAISVTACAHYRVIVT